MCVFFLGDHDLKVDFDGTECKYIYINMSIYIQVLRSGFVLVGCQSDIDCGFYSYIVHLYVAKFYLHCHMILFAAPSHAIFHVLGLPPPSLQKNRHWCTLILRLLEIFQRCEAERERNLLMPFRYVVVLTKTDLSKWPGDSTRKEPATFVSVVARASSCNH